MTDHDPPDALPLKPVWFHILLTIAEGGAHGYSIRKAVETRTGGRLKLWPTTLYGALSDLSGLGFIAEDDGVDEKDDNLGRIRYRLTEPGKQVLRAETDRLERLVLAARAAQGPRPQEV